MVSIIVMTGLGLFFAFVLAVAHTRFRIDENPKISLLESELPGVNCGACGYTSCHLYAEALCEKGVMPDLCKVGGREVAVKLSEILGIEPRKYTRFIAVVHCGADNSVRKKKAEYIGIKSCRAASMVFGGEVLCRYGCMGYGDCKRACPFGAISMKNGLPEVDKDKCTGCGKCQEACPRKIITIEEMKKDNMLYIACSSRDNARDTRGVCKVGCIACGICQKLTDGIFHVEDNISIIDYARIEEVKDEVVDKCPVKCIRTI